MSVNYTTEELVSFLNGKLDPAKTAEIKLEAQKNTALATEIEDQRKLARMVQIAVLQENLNTIHAEYNVTAPKVVNIDEAAKKKSTWPLIAIAAAITGLVVFLVIHKSSFSYNTTLFNKYYSDDTGAPSLMGGNATPFDQAMVYYKAGDYEKAAFGFGALLQNSPLNDTLKYYEALSLVKTGESGKALTLLRAVKPAAGSDLYVRAQWYQALIHLKQGRTKETAAELMLLEKSKSVYADKAALLKKDLAKALD